MQQDLLNSLRTFSSSRRHYLKAASIAGGLAAATTLAPSSIAGIALAESAFQADGDLGVLNYALTLEHLEAALYRDLNASGLLTGKAADYAREFGAHESAHVDALTKTITQLGGTPVQAQAAYNWPKLTTQAEVLDILATVEDVGASAYLGAAPLLKNADLLTVAVQIHTNEAWHATAFRALAGQDFVPFAFAPARTMAEVVAMVTPFLQAPSTMPNTGAADDALKMLGVASGIAAIAGGLALARSQKHEEGTEAA